MLKIGLANFYLDSNKTNDLKNSLINSETLNKEKVNIVYILWGRKAQEKGQFLDKKNNLIIESTHPSPFSANNGFFGSKPFSKANSYLSEKNMSPIDWAL